MPQTEAIHFLAINLNSEGCRTKEKVENESCGMVRRLYQTTYSWESWRPLTSVHSWGREGCHGERNRDSTAEHPCWTSPWARVLRCNFMSISGNLKCSPIIYVAKRKKAQDRLTLYVFLIKRVILYKGAGTWKNMALISVCADGLGSQGVADLLSGLGQRCCEVVSSLPWNSHGGGGSQNHHFLSTLTRNWLGTPSFSFP